VARYLWAGPSGVAALSPGRAGLPGKRSHSGQGAGRAEITGSREGAKPRSSDEKRTIFRQSPRAASVEPFLGKGHPSLATAVAHQAGPFARTRSGGEEDRSDLRTW